jgi:hypothetical protein
MGNARLEVGKKFLAANNSRLHVIESGKYSGLWQRNWAGMIFPTNVQGTFDGGAYGFASRRR